MLAWFLTGLAGHPLRDVLAFKGGTALRQRTVAGMEQAIAGKEDRLRRLWTNRLAHQVSQLPPYDDVFREVLRVVRAGALPKL